ncbi:MAG: hypothetical protein U9Q88_14380 [Bacillota bacterium]|nr:hypothetical protein [Bacillota bacterium]
MKTELIFTGNFGEDCQLVWDNMKALQLDSNNYASDRGVYRMYFSFMYKGKNHTNIKAFYDPNEENFMFIPYANELGFTEYEWSIVQNVIAIVTKKEYNL